jgi:hypothetical protein
MAGIEKVCEYSGEYPGFKMYGYKRNNIQVMPKYRKLFKHQDHVLVISKSELKHDMGWATSSVNKRDLDNKEGSIYYTTKKSDVITTSHGSKWRGPGYYAWTGSTRKGHTKQYLTKKQRIVQEYMYNLYIPGLPGEVEGHYFNWSRDLTTVKRKLKRLLGVKKLNIIEVDCRYDSGSYTYCDTEKMRVIAEDYFSKGE